MWTYEGLDLFDVTKNIDPFELSKHINAFNWSIVTDSIDQERVYTLLLVNDLLDLQLWSSSFSKTSRNDMKKSARRAKILVESNSIALDELSKIYDLLLDSEAREIIWDKIKELEAKKQLSIVNENEELHIESEKICESWWINCLSVWDNVVLYSDKKYKAKVVAVSKTIVICSYIDDKWITITLPFDNKTWDYLASPSCAYISRKKTPN